MLSIPTSPLLCLLFLCSLLLACCDNATNTTLVANTTNWNSTLTNSTTSNASSIVNASETSTSVVEVGTTSIISNSSGNETATGINGSSSQTVNSSTSVVNQTNGTNHSANHTVNARNNHSKSLHGCLRTRNNFVTGYFYTSLYYFHTRNNFVTGYFYTSLYFFRTRNNSVTGYFYTSLYLYTSLYHSSSQLCKQQDKCNLCHYDLSWGEDKHRLASLSDEHPVISTLAISTVIEGYTVDTFGKTEINMYIDAVSKVLGVDKSRIKDVQDTNKFSQSLTKDALTSQLQSAGLTKAVVSSVDVKAESFQTPSPPASTGRTAFLIMVVLVAVGGFTVLFLVLLFLYKSVFNGKCCEWGGKENRIHQDPQEDHLSIVTGGDAEREREAKTLFVMMDKDGNKAISHMELELGLAAFGFSSAEIEEILFRVFSAGSEEEDELSFERFREAIVPLLTQKTAGKEEEAMALALFKQFDADGNGSISEEELDMAMSKFGFSNEEISRIMYEAEDGTGSIDLPRFKKFVLPYVATVPVSKGGREARSPAQLRGEGEGGEEPSHVPDLYRLVVFDGGDKSLGIVEIQKDTTWKQMLSLLQSKFDLHQLVGLKYVDPRENSKLDYSRNEEEWRRCLEVLCAEEDRELEVDLVTEPPVKAFRIKVPVSEVDKKIHKKKIYFTNFYDREVSFVISSDCESPIIVRIKKMDKEHEEIAIVHLTEEQSKIIHTLKLFVTWS
ncbi:hypothetical protein GUITHDRAFT_133247 [Guillardia theta CCMP2712]|uniref:EF-hand domain-containing protein n=1 Tax=Guillardia theta (strain CCMP2712) TaxID=905079 RepID=L1JWU8_GUITC|nr:hypothetical protein GUITHDRAFT_133247 [Guillardia theta CCMP2712]EKX52817.1 hypothetical protein GUITHDRAFT_133247 [Guillardia theta CCMP2712]|eukprot:XP_005839797.1 hypothetical protein GUITHDRAFT_133247 [Guillardia theta CCMP2712]